MSAKRITENDGEIVERRVAVRAIPEKLEFLYLHFSMSRPVFVEEFSRKYNSYPRNVQSWCEAEKLPREPSLDKLTRYWNSKINGFTHALWIMDFDDFKEGFLKLLQQQRILPIELPYNLIKMSDEEMDGITGTYVTHRKSFFNDGRTSREFLMIRKPDSGDRSYFDAEVYAAADTETKDGDRDANEQNRYSGKMYKYGDTYYAFVSATHENVSRIRMICFPVTSNFRARKRWGIISAGASVDRLPVSARILASKLEDTCPASLGNPGRFKKENLDLTRREVMFICNDITNSPASPEGKDHILTVSTGFVDLH
jgi:hypothetical protein